MVEQSETSNRARRPWTAWLRRYGLSAWWLVFASITIDWARSPGFVDNPQSVPYPWGGVVITWTILAVETGILYAILRPPTFVGTRGRLGAAMLYSGSSGK
jgi:hypothetical protein